MTLTDNLAFWCLLAGHLLGDFYFTAQPVEQRPRPGIRHLLVNALTLAPVLLVCGGGWVPLWAWAAAAGAHAVVDGLSLGLEKPLKKRPGTAFALDQLLHVGTLAAVALGWGASLTPGALWDLPCWGYPPAALLRLFCLGLFLVKPANVLLKVCNRKFQAAEGGRRNAGVSGADRHAGAVIGSLERLLTALLVLLGQYGGIGFVFAAKTLTRYPRMTDNEAFGEYYLIGTLGSLLCAVLAALLLFPPS